jgi:hypothetical protein
MSRASSSMVRALPVGPDRTQRGASQLGAPLHQRPTSSRRPLRSRGWSAITVSIISSCAGSVAVSARPALPCTDATSGNPHDDAVLIGETSRASRWRCPRTSWASPAATPSSSGGMNSDPEPHRHGHRARHDSRRARRRPSARAPRARAMGRYTREKSRLNGVLRVGAEAPRASSAVISGGAASPRGSPPRTSRT